MRHLGSPWAKPLVLAVLLLACALALIGWMHTRAGQRALSALGVACPIDTVTAAQALEGHRLGLAAIRGTSPTTRRPALGLRLDETTQAQAVAWASAKALNCESIVRGLHYLRCRDVPARAIGLGGPPISEVWLSFSSNNTLIGLNVYRRGLSPGDLEAAWAGSVGRLKEQLGTPSEQTGDATAVSLVRSGYTSAQVQYRFSNYIATITAANLAYNGLSLREQYVSGNS